MCDIQCKLISRSTKNAPSWMKAGNWSLHMQAMTIESYCAEWSVFLQLKVWTPLTAESEKHHHKSYFPLIAYAYRDSCTYYVSHLVILWNQGSSLIQFFVILCLLFHPPSWKNGFIFCMVWASLAISLSHLRTYMNFTKRVSFHGETTILSQIQIRVRYVAFRASTIKQREATR